MDFNLQSQPLRPTFRSAKNILKSSDVLTLELKQPDHFLPIVKNKQDLNVDQLRSNSWHLTKQFTLKRLFTLTVYLDHEEGMNTIDLQIVGQSDTGHNKDLYSMWQYFSFDLYFTHSPTHGEGDILSHVLSTNGHQVSSYCSMGIKCNVCSQKKMCYRVDSIFPLQQLVSSFLYWEDKDKKAKLDIFLAVSFEGGSKNTGMILQVPLNKFSEIHPSVGNFNGPLFREIRCFTNPLADVVVFSKDNKQFYAHRSIIFACSQALAAAITKSIKEEDSINSLAMPFQLYLESLSEENTHKFLKYVYLGIFNPYEWNFSAIVQLLNTAVKYEMTDLCELCCKFICGSTFDKFDAESTLQLFFMELPLIQKERVKEKAMKAFKANATKVLESPEYNKLLDAHRNRGLEILQAIFSNS